jgi:hypothetical protein
MDRPNTSSEGSLFELVARGQKDVFFYSNEKSATVPYSYNIATWPAIIDETRQTQPLNMVDFGRTVEWEFEVFGDIMISAALVVDLPTWLPPEVAPLNSSTVIQDASGVRYGYTNGIGAFLFEQIQFYADQVLLQEFSGDFLYAWSHLQGTLNQEVLALREFGAHPGTALDIQRNATPGRLYLRLPLIGVAHPDEGGLPFIALPGQKYRLRCRLRRLEDLVESSSGAIKPTPWTRTDLTWAPQSGVQTPIQVLPREKIPAPLVTLETTQRYIRQDLQDLLKKTKIEIPFLRPFENVLSLDPADYVSVGNGGASYITKRIDGRHPAEALLITFQSDYRLERNQPWNFTNPSGDGTYYNGLKFVVAAKDRETIWGADLWEHIAPFVKSEKNPGTAISVLSFTTGPAFGYRAPERRRPAGTLNFTGADKPTLWMDITDTLPARSGQKRVAVRATTLGWGVYVVENQRGALLFGN